MVEQQSRGWARCGRPRRARRLAQTYNNIFKPQGVPSRELEQITITQAEAEALRLVDQEGQNQESAAKTLKISQPTLNRELKSARRKVAEALLTKKALIIGGETMPNRDGTGPLGKGPRTGRGLGPCGQQEGETPITPPGRGLGRGAGLGAGRGAGRGAGLGAGRGAGRGRRW